MLVNGYEIMPGADLRRADLQGADLQGAKYSLLTILSIDFSNVFNEELITEMMKWGASAHPNPEAFEAWAGGDSCPLNTSSVDRLLNFNENRSGFEVGPPTMTLWQLWVAIAEELDIKI